ncbi:DUF2946 family protein [Armatimonas sp.]|uniref:DUF2946 family protein n=1 Tax=Armatimonas sp. TaxID=1872638 RepID=UPI00374D5B10
MLGTLRRYEKPLGRFLAVFLLTLQVFTQLGHYREHRPSTAAARHARHHAATPHTDIVAREAHHTCALCVLTSSSATLSVPLLLASQTLTALPAARLLPKQVGFVQRSLRCAPPRAPPFS